MAWRDFSWWWRDYGVTAGIAPQVVARFGQSFETKEIGVLVQWDRGATAYQCRAIAKEGAQ
jgi:hypothetical protein